MAERNKNESVRFPGVPRWITPELVADTLETWQPYYNEQLTVADAMEILLSVSRLVDALQNYKPLEKAS